MQTFFTDHWQLVVSFITVLLLILSYLLREKLKSQNMDEENMERKIDEMEAELKEIKDNYLNRFELVMQKLNDMAMEQKTAMSRIESKVDAQKQLCKYIQEQKIK